MIYTAVLIITLFFTSTLPCSPPHPLSAERPIVSLENLTDSTTENCNFTLISPKKVINPYRQAIDNRVEPKPFGAFWLKCAACLAVANEIGKTTKNAIQILEDSVNSDAGFSVNDHLFGKFGELCSSGFKKLRELCNLYTSYMDIGYIANNYINSTQNLSTFLCKGTGIFRDCGNMEINNFAQSIKQLNRCEKNHCC